jgi:hypothetical protein
MRSGSGVAGALAVTNTGLQPVTYEVLDDQVAPSDAADMLDGHGAVVSATQHTDQYLFERRVVLEHGETDQFRVFVKAYGCADTSHDGPNHDGLQPVAAGTYTAVGVLFWVTSGYTQPNGPPYQHQGVWTTEPQSVTVTN